MALEMRYERVYSIWSKMRLSRLSEAAAEDAAAELAAARDEQKKRPEHRNPPQPTKPFSQAVVLLI